MKLRESGTVSAHAASPARAREVGLRVLTWVLLVLAMSRGVALLVHEPMVGLANNYDMIRVQACIDAYPVRAESVPPWSNSWQAPIEAYRFRDDVDAECFMTSESLIAWVARPALAWEAKRDAAQGATASATTGAFSMRTVGWFKLTLLGVACVVISLLLIAQGRAGAAAVNALIAALVLMDPGVTLYLNTFYAEFSALLFGYLAVGLAFVLLGEPTPGRGCLILLGVAVVLACLSKVQHLAFGLMLLGALGFAARVSRRKVRRALTITLLVSGALGAAAQIVHLNTAATASMGRANITNVVFEAVLGSSSAPSRTAAALGLPEHCSAMAGANWFSPGVAQQHPCPEVFEVSRLRIVSLAFSEPDTLARAWGRGLLASRPWIPPLLGKVARRDSAPLPEALYTIDGWLSGLPVPLYALLLFGPAILMLLALASSVPRRLPVPVLFVLATLAALPPCMLSIVVLGDGLADTAKQFHLAIPAAVAFWLIAAAVVPGTWLARCELDDEDVAAAAAR